MNSLTHFIFAANLLILIFGANTSLKLLLLFAFLFGVLVDIDVFWKMGIKKDKSPITRTWIQEPFGLLIIGGSLSAILQLTMGTPFGFFVLIPYTSHVFLDYISCHQVRPFDPFRKTVYSVGFIDVRLLNTKDLKDWSGINENYFLLANILILIVLIY